MRKNKHAQKLVQLRWANLTPEQRKEQSQKAVKAMNRAKKKKTKELSTGSIDSMRIESKIEE